MHPNKVIEIAQEIWEHMPHELKFSYFKKTHDLFIERNQHQHIQNSSQSTDNNENDENISIRNMIRNLYNNSENNDENNDENNYENNDENNDENNNEEHDDSDLL
jgi:hypothetical protein